MRVAVAAISQESGSFLPQLTEVEHFERGVLAFGDDFGEHIATSTVEVGGARDVLRTDHVVPLMGAMALPWGPLSQRARAYLLDEFERSLVAAGTIDAMFLMLHGALLAEDDHDVDGTVLELARQMLGPDVPIGASLDSHAHVTERMIANADVLVTYATVPHVDYYDTGARVATLLAGTMRGQWCPVLTRRRLPMITPAETHDTSEHPMRSLVSHARRLESQPGLLSCSIANVQPWIDVPDLGWATIAVADSSMELAQRAADEVAMSAWNLREEFLVEKVPPVRAVAICAASTSTVIVSDSGDNTGGGAAGDSTVLLDAVLQAPEVPRSVLLLTDAAGAAKAHTIGVGKRDRFVIGASVDMVASRPVEIDALVSALPNGNVTVHSETLNGYVMELGNVAILEAGDVTVIVTEHPMYNIDPSILRQLGVEPSQYQLVHTKSPCGFRTGYTDVSTDVVLMESPGFTTSDFASLPWHNIDRPLFPLDVTDEHPW